MQLKIFDITSVGSEETMETVNRFLRVVADGRRSKVVVK